MSRDSSIGRLQVTLYLCARTVITKVLMHCSSPLFPLPVLPALPPFSLVFLSLFLSFHFYIPPLQQRATLTTHTIPQHTSVKMIVDPVEALAKSTPTGVAPVPTVVPSLPEYQDASDVGNRTLW